MSTATDFKESLQTALQARSPALDGVEIYKTEQTVPDRKREHIILGDWDGAQEHYAMGGVMLQTVDFECRIVIHKPTQDEATSRAEALLKEVDDELSADQNWTLGDTVLDTDLVSWSVKETLDTDEGRVCTIEFVVQYRDTNE